MRFVPQHILCRPGRRAMRMPNARQARHRMCRRRRRITTADQRQAPHRMCRRRRRIDGIGQGQTPHRMCRRRRRIDGADQGQTPHRMCRRRRRIDGAGHRSNLNGPPAPFDALRSSAHPMHTLPPGNAMPNIGCAGAGGASSAYVTVTSFGPPGTLWSMRFVPQHILCTPCCRSRGRCASFLSTSYRRQGIIFRGAGLGGRDALLINCV